MNSIFFNKRIEGPFKETYKGYNQYIFTGDIDDLFLMDSSEQGNRKLCRIEEAFVEYGKKEKYDIVITVNDDQNLSFGNSEQEKLFNRLASGSSEKLVEEGKKAKAFIPRKKREEQSSASQSQTNENATNPNAQNSKRQVEEQAQGNDGLNRLNKITRVLQENRFKTLVIYPNPEKMIVGGNVDAPTMQKIEVVVKKWRDIIQEANPATRTILIVNPHRLKEFRMVEHTLSCYDHNCKEITISNPPNDEMAKWLSKYRRENNIQGTKNDKERVVLTGRANVGGSLQNFISWVQGFYWTNQDSYNWSDLLAYENQEAAESVEGLLDRLKEMIGLSDVKNEIEAIVKDARKNIETAAEAAYHMFFLGNPGTGKTVVADIVARLFWALELRTSKKVVNVAIQDIVSQYNEGDTLQKMKDKVQEAMGGVLFIDEAYLFAESDWGRKAFQVLLTEMENNRKNLTVILAGYEDRLQALKDINPGIDSRIPYKLHFRDYSKEEKLEIFKFHLKKETEKKDIKPVLTGPAEQKLLRVLDACEGNGRGVRNILEKTLKNADGASEITEQHVVDPHEIHPDEAEKVMQDIEREFIGMASLKERLKQYFMRIQYSVMRNNAMGITKPSNYAYRIRFTGPPGTGKTSIARYMGRFFHAMGITETDGFQECGATSLKGAYVGHAQKAVNNLFHENRGKVIFIDEIYSLYNPDAHQDDSFSREVIDTLVRCLTAEEYQSTVVIVAGYKDRVDKFMEANPGLASRIPDEIEFENYSANDCYKIFVAEAQKHQYEVLDGCQEKLEAYFQTEIDKNQSNFGNARDVKATFGLVETNIMNRIFANVQMSDLAKTMPTREQFTQITPEDIPAATPIAEKDED